MRVPDSALYRFFMQGISSRRSDMDKAIRSLADGKRVRKASDDPSGASESLSLRGRLARIEGYQRAAKSGRFDLATVDNVLGEVVNYLTDARTEAMAGASNVHVDGNNARADKVDAIREQLILLANTEHDGRYLFAGTETLTSPFAADGTYNGNNDEVQASLDSGLQVGTTMDGERVFLGPAGDIFQTLEDLSTALRANDAAAVGTLIPELRGEIDHVTEVRADLGNRMNMVDSFLGRQEDEKLHLAMRISEIEDVSLEDVAVQLTAADTSLQALSATASRVLGRSLFDFIG